MELKVVSNYISATGVTLTILMKTGWRLYDPQQQADLNAYALSGATVFQIDINGTFYEINLNSWNQINTANRTKTRKIKHDFPNWAGGNSTFQPSGQPPTITQQSSSNSFDCCIK
jgi:WWE domain